MRGWVGVFTLPFLAGLVVCGAAPGCGGGAAQPSGDDGDPCTTDLCDPGPCVHPHTSLAPCDQPPCAVDGACLWVVSRASLSLAEQVLVQTLQGVLAKNRPALWLDGAGWQGFADDLVARHGVTFHAAPDGGVAALLGAFRPALAGYVLFDLNQPSEAVAASLAGPWKAVAVEASLEPVAKAAGLPLLLDARGRDPAWCLAEYGSLFARDVLVKQIPDDRLHGYLLDFAALRNAFVFTSTDAATTTQVVSSFGPAPVVYGWGPSEHDVVEAVSKGDGGVAAADWCSNLSVLSLAREAKLDQPSSPVAVPPVEDGTHYVAFVISDGDNLDYFENTFMDENWYGSPYRGTFPITWELTPAAADVIPSLVAWYYARATPMDTFVAPPTGIGYSFPVYRKTMDAYVARSAEAMARADLRVVSIMDDGQDLSGCDPFLDQPGILGAIYKDYWSYDGHQGAVRWRAGKPALSYRYRIWQGKADSTPTAVAQSLNAAPTRPGRDVRSFSLVAVHAWSEWPDSPPGKGAVAAVAWAVQQLQPHVKVVSAEEILVHLAGVAGAGPLCGDGNCDPGETCTGCPEDCKVCLDICGYSSCQGEVTCENCPGDCGPCKTGPATTFDAMTALAHGAGAAAHGGWGAGADGEPAGWLVSGPGTTTVPGGWHTAVFSLAVGDPIATAGTVVARVEIHDLTTDTILASREVTGSQFAAAYAFQPVPLVFRLLSRHSLEFRVWFAGVGWLGIQLVVIDG